MEFPADNDGKLNKDELTKFIDDFVNNHPGPGGPDGGPGGGGERPDRPQRPEY